MARKKRINESINIISETLNEEILKSPRSKKINKVKFALYLKKLNENIKLNEKQTEYSNKIYNNKITLSLGAAGTGKTISACYTLLKLLFEGKIEKIIFTKPIKESGENLGFLPGDISQKIEPYAESFIYTCEKLLNKKIIEELIKEEIIENRPLAYMRGITFENCGLFCDEAQNATMKQIMLYMTRYGKNSKMIIAGDITQSDIKASDVCLMDIIKMLEGINDIAFHEFLKEDIVRDKLLIEITERYEKWKDNKEKKN